MQTKFTHNSDCSAAKKAEITIVNSFIVNSVLPDSASSCDLEERAVRTAATAEHPKDSENTMKVKTRQCKAVRAVNGQCKAFSQWFTTCTRTCDNILEFTGRIRSHITKADPCRQVPGHGGKQALSTRVPKAATSTHLESATAVHRRAGASLLDQSER